MTDHMEFWKRLALSGTHPTQMQILEVAKRGGLVSPNGLSVELDVPIGNTSYHVKELVKKGMLELEKTEPRRGAVEHFYRAGEDVLTAEPRVGRSEEVALAALEDPFFEALAAGVSVDQVAERFTQVAERETREAVAA